MAAESVTVIGGGIVGLAVAERLSRTGLRVTVLEKEDVWAGHQTGHNSGVIHAGPYYKPGSLKARLCTAGNQSMVDFAVEHGIPFERCGKLIVAVDAGEVPLLDALRDRAVANGVVTRVLSAEETLDYEPNVRAVKALRVEATGIIDYAAVSRKLAELASINGARLILGARAEDIRVSGRGVSVGFGTVASTPTSWSIAPVCRRTGSLRSPGSSPRCGWCRSGASTTNSCHRGATSSRDSSTRSPIRICRSWVCTSPG